MNCGTLPNRSAARNSAAADPAQDGEMRASRMVTLLLHLRVRGQASCAEPALQMEDSERTARRDWEALCWV